MLILTNWDMRSSWNTFIAPMAKVLILTNWDMRSSWNVTGFAAADIADFN